MTLPQFIHRCRLSVLTTGVLMLVLLVGLADRAGAAEPPTQALRAPFECGTEWAGTTRGGHGYLDRNLDINSTERTFADRNHDMNAPLLAQADGVVAYLGDHVSAGAYIDIDYGEITARYVHLVRGSIPTELTVGTRIPEGAFFGRLGASGNASHAHLHLEYLDSRAYENEHIWPIDRSEIQIQITMDGEPIEPGETFISTNCNGSLIPEAGPSYPFPDVDPASFAYIDIALLHELGITTGTSTTTYSPADDVTREQMAAFLARMWRLAEPGPAAATAEEPEYPFPDVDPASFAYADIALLHELGITTGTSATTYSPADDVTREQMAAFLARIWRLANAATAD